VAREWAWLFGRAAVTSFRDPTHFFKALVATAPRTGADDNQGEDSGTGDVGTLWLVLFTDGVDCQPCKTAKTNLLRVSAGLFGLPAAVGMVDCTQPALAAFCYQAGSCLGHTPGTAAEEGEGKAETGPSNGDDDAADWVAAAVQLLPCHALPAAPHAPVLKAFVGGQRAMASSDDGKNLAASFAAAALQGEALYNNNEVAIRSKLCF
jgi:hypothetical protein